MHVVIDARLAGQRPGGIATYSRELCQALATMPDGPRLTVLRHRHATPLPLPATTGQRRALTPAHHRWEGVTLGLEVAALRPDLLHATDVVPPALRCWPCVTTVHDVAFLRWPEVLANDGRRYYGQIHQAVTTADHVIAVSETTRRDLCDYLGLADARVTVVPQGVGAAFQPLAPAARAAAVVAAAARPAVAALALGEAGAYYLTVGTIEPRKNLPLLLAAYDRLAARWPAAPRLVLAGSEGWLADDTWRALAAMTARDRVTWIDRPTLGELAVLYAGALALAFPSRYEGFGLPALEAMACGTPVLAADRSALREVVGTAGWLLAPDDVATWSDALAEIAINEAEQAHLAAAGVARAAQFTWAATASATMAVYRAVLAGA